MSRLLVTFTQAWLEQTAHDLVWRSLHYAQKTVAHCDYLPLIAHMKACTSGHQSLGQTEIFRKPESYIKMSGYFIFITNISTTHTSLVI